MKPKTDSAQLKKKTQIPLTKVPSTEDVFAFVLIFLIICSPFFLQNILPQSGKKSLQQATVSVIKFKKLYHRAYRLSIKKL